MEVTGVDRPAARRAVDGAGGSVRTAIVMVKRGLDRPAAEALLAARRSPGPGHPRRSASGGGIMTERPMLAVGLMSGTSLDGMDAALVRVRGPTAVELLEFVHLPYTAEHRRRIEAAIAAGGTARAGAPACRRRRLGGRGGAAGAGGCRISGPAISTSSPFRARPSGTSRRWSPGSSASPRSLAEAFGVRVVSGFRGRATSRREGRARRWCRSPTCCCSAPIIPGCCSMSAGWRTSPGCRAARPTMAPSRSTPVPAWRSSMRWPGSPTRGALRRRRRAGRGRPGGRGRAGRAAGRPVLRRAAAQEHRAGAVRAGVYRGAGGARPAA